MTDTDSHAERARLLLQRDRPRDAMKHVAAALADDPQDVDARLVEVHARLRLEEWDAATEAAEAALGLAPDEPVAHDARARVAFARGRLKEALASAREAVRLDPDEPDFHALEAAVHAARSRWSDAARAAERALALDATHGDALNVRALAMRQLGERDEGAAALRVALARDPDDPATHVNAGWAALDAGRLDDGVRHFREALRLDPNDRAAREGLATALRSKLPLARPLLRWTLWCDRLTPGTAIALTLGLLVAVNVVTRNLPDTGVWPTVGTAIGLAYGGFVWLTWAASSALDLVMLARRDTRGVLTTRERVGAGLVVACLALAVASSAALWAVGLAVFVPRIAMTWFFAAIPIAGTVPLERPRNRRLGAAIACVPFLALAVGLALLGRDHATDTIHLFVGEQPVWLVLFDVALWTAILSTWILPGLLVSDRRR